MLLRLSVMLFVAWTCEWVQAQTPTAAEAVASLQPGRYAGFWGHHQISTFYQINEIQDGRVSGTVEVVRDSRKILFETTPQVMAFALERDADGGWIFQWPNGLSQASTSDAMRIHRTMNGPLLTGRFTLDGTSSRQSTVVAGFWVDPEAVTFNPFDLVAQKLTAQRTFPARVTYHGAADGLAHNACRSSVITADGHLWIGTIGGLSRFDGSEWVTFTTANSDIPEDNVTALAENHLGELMIGTKNSGICRYANGEFSRPWPQWQDQRITDLTAADDSMWIDWHWDRFGRIAPDGTFREWRFSELNLPGVETGGDGFKISIRDKLLFCTHGGLCLLDPDQGATTVMGVRSRMVVSGPNGYMHAAGSHFTITKDLLKHRSFQISSESGPIQHLLANRNGDYWIITNSMLLHFDDANRILSYVPSFPEEFCETSQNLLEDRQGNLWVITGQQGAVQVEPQCAEVVLSESRYDFMPQTVMAGPEGDVYVTADSRVEHFKGSSRMQIKRSPRLNFYTGIATAKDQPVWVGLTPRDDRDVDPMPPFGRLTRDEIDLEGIPVLNDRPMDTWSGLLVRRNGEVWVAGEGGAYWYDGERIRNYNDFIGMQRGAVETMFEDSHESLWFGTPGFGAFQADDLTAPRQYTKATHGLPSDTIYSFYEDSDGGMWIGTDRGLAYWDREAQRAHLIDQAPIATLHVGAIVEDLYRRLWIGTPRGIYVMALDDLARHVINGASFPLRAITRRDGLVNETVYAYHFPTACRASDGLLYFCMEGGLAKIDPSRLPQATQGPPIRIRAASTSDEQRTFWSRTLPNAITFPPSAQNLLRIDYGAIALTRPDKVRYQYRLIGVDDQWNTVGGQRSAWYPHLQAGTYRFEVQATDFRQSVSPEPAVLAFTIAKYPYQTWWFRFSAGLGILILLGSGLMIWMRSRAKVIALKKDLEMESERTRIARDMHDEIGSALAQIGMLGQLASQTADADATNTKIRQLAKHCSQSLREIIWSLTPQHNRIEDLETYLRHYIDQALDGSGTIPIYQFTDIDNDDRELSPAIRRQLVLIVKGILSNVLKHAQAKEFQLHLESDESQLTLTAHDSGVGFDPQDVAPDAIGLTTMRERAAQLNGTLTVDSHRHRGTRIMLTVPLS